MTTVYVGMALTEAPILFRERFRSDLKTVLTDIPDVEIIDFIGLENGTAVDVYEWDRGSVEKVDLCLFIVDYPSTGLGMEIAFRLLTDEPLLIFHKEEARVTRMLTGMCEREGVPIFEYKNMEGIINTVREYIDSEM